MPLTFDELIARGALILSDGYRTKASELGSPGIPILRVAEVADGFIEPTFGDHVREEYRSAIGAKVSRSGDVLLTTKGTVGRRAIVPVGFPEFAYSPQLCFFRPVNGSIDCRWLYYWLGGPEFWQQASGVATQTDMAPYISLRDLRAIRIQVPHLPEQQAISGTLGALDDKIESNRRAIDRSMRLARSYVDRATAGRGTVAYDVALDVRMGAAFKGEAFSSPGVGRPLLRIRDLKSFESQTWTTEERRDETVIHPGDIVVGMDAEFRATLWLGADSVLNQRVCSFAGKPGIGRAFVLAALEPELAFQEAAKTGTTVIHLNKADIGTFQVPALTAAEHQALASLTEPLIDFVVARSAENRRLARLRDVLLPELLAGRIHVPEAQEAVA